MDLAIARLDAALRAAGIPIHGCAMLDKAQTPPTVRIDFQDSATAAQRTQAQTIAADTSATAWWRPRQKRTHAALMTAIGNLSTADRTKLINLMLADFLREHPKIAAQFGVAGMDGDEVA
jgi:hypothetical protein